MNSVMCQNEADEEEFGPWNDTERKKIDAQKVKHARVLQQKTEKMRTSKEAAVQHIPVIHHTLKKLCSDYESQKMATVLQELNEREVA